MTKLSGRMKKVYVPTNFAYTPEDMGREIAETLFGYELGEEALELLSSKECNAIASVLTEDQRDQYPDMAIDNIKDGDVSCELLYEPLVDFLNQIQIDHIRTLLFTKKRPYKKKEQPRGDNPFGIEGSLNMKEIPR